MIDYCDAVVRALWERVLPPRGPRQSEHNLRRMVIAAKIHSRAAAILKAERENEPAPPPAATR
jgi:hypothetical protein